MIIGDKNKLEIKVINTEEIYSFYYRVPTVEEWLDYSWKIRAAFKLEPDLQEKEIVRIKLNAAEQVLEGIEDGQFEIKIDGEVRPLSSDPESPHFNKDWKSLLKKEIFFLLMLIPEEAFTRGEIVVEKK